MSKDTNLRYELPPKPNTLYREYLKNLQAGEVQLEKNQDQKLFDRKALHDEWLERSDVKLRAKAMNNEKKQLQLEFLMVAKANILVRRRCLAQRLEADRQIYEQELANCGKSFHTELI